MHGCSKFRVFKCGRSIHRPLPGKIMKHWYKWAVLLLFSQSCSNVSQSGYIGSLGLKATSIEPKDSIDLEAYGILAPRQIERFGDWFAVSSSKTEFNIYLINPQDGQARGMIRRGRGPGEIAQGCSMHKYDETLIFNDATSATCISVDVEKSILSGQAVMDTIGRFSGNPSRPYFLSKAEDGFISGNSMDPNTWYSFYDHQGRIVSSVEALGYPDLQISSKDTRTSTMLSSVYTYSSRRKRACVANVATGSISFSNLSDGILNEFSRYEKESPEGQISHFNCITSDDDHVYALYSGREITDTRIPCNECNYLIVFDWDGTPIRLFHLRHSLSSICRDRDGVTGITTSPLAKIYHYSCKI